MRRSVAGKLVGIVLLTTVSVLVVAVSSILIHDLSVYRASWADDIATEANLLSLSVVPAIAFDDKAAAQNSLLALRTRPAIVEASIYRSDGKLYAQYTRDAASQPARVSSPRPVTQGMRVSGQTLELAQPIQYNGETLGTLYVLARYDLASRVKTYLGIFAIITALSFGVALGLATPLMRTFTKPVESIADVARQIVERRDYGLRVTRTTDDEIGIVVDAFNRMLDEVSERTRALESSNESLRSEVGVRQAAEQALAIASARLESTMAAAEIGGWVWDLERKELTVDRNCAALYGFADESALVRDPGLRLQRIHPDDRDAVDAAERDALQTGILGSIEYRILQPEGPPRWVISRGRVLRDADGTPQRLTGLLIDITAQKRADQERRASERVYRAIGESIQYGIWITDESGRNVYASDSFLRLTGLTQAQCAESGWGAALHPAERDATLRAWEECVASGQPWYREHRIRGVDGRYHPILAQGVPIHTDDERIAGWAGINLDISRLKRTEDALREADRRKDDFLATLAHELRNPLGPIRHATHILGSPAATDAQRAGSREVIARQVQHMALLLDDLLEISRITRGRLELRPSPTSLHELLSSALEVAKPLIDAKHHRVEIDLATRPLVLDVDPLRISQALANLLTNAAKYTDDNGCITIRADVEDGVRISVSDTGMGLNEAAIPRLFEMFSQVHGVLERSQGGLGIGLALVKGLVELHGGTVAASSPGLGRGSTFTIRLPASCVQRGPAIERASATSLQTSAPIERLRHKVLVADDNRDSAESLADLLRLEGYEVLVAGSGTEALEIARTEHAEMLILDIGMPGMTGYEVATQIRLQEWGDAHPLLIALTGWGRQEDIERAHATGFDHHMRKPVDLDELRSRLANFCVSRSDSARA